MSNKQFERLVSNLQGVMRCPHCSGSYQLSDIHYLGQMDAMTFLHMRCTACHTPVFASVALTNDQGEIKPADIATNQINSPSISSSEEEVSAPRFNTKQLNLEDPVSDTKSVDIPVEDIVRYEEEFHVWTETNAKDVLDHIRETGQLAPEEDMNNIFQPFYRGNNVWDKVHGAGLGLALANRIIRLHKGNIIVDSEVNRGSIFRIYLPVE